jgi:protein transport protein SEC31
LVANDDDSSPSLNIWDLRNPNSPVCTFPDIHYSGILGVTWSLNDPSMIVSSGRDFRTVVLNYKTGETILEIPASKAFSKL